MENLNSRIKKMNITSIIFSIVFLVIGIFLLTKPEGALNIVSYSLGGMLLIWGIILMIQFFYKKDSQNFLELSFIVGILVFIFGILILIKPNTIAEIIPLLLGVWMIANGVAKLSCALTINKNAKTATSIVISILIIVVGLLLVINPFEGAVVLTQIIGATMIVYSILDLAACFFIKKVAKTVKDVEIKVIEAEYKEK